MKKATDQTKEQILDQLADELIKESELSNSIFIRMGLNAIAVKKLTEWALELNNLYKGGRSRSSTQATNEKIVALAASLAQLIKEESKGERS